MADEAREAVALLRSLTDTIAATLQACACGNNLEFSNEALEKAKSSEVRLYRKAPSKASKKNSAILEGGLRVNRLLQRRSVRRRKPNAICEHVEDGASYQLELPGSFRFR
jgi:hypothetical protein